MVQAGLTLYPAPIDTAPPNLSTTGPSVLKLTVRRRACVFSIGYLAASAAIIAWFAAVPEERFIVLALFLPLAVLFLIARLSLRCPVCGKNVYRRDILPPTSPAWLLTTHTLPWPEAECSRCGNDLTSD
jgi:hypothetical protein